MPWRSMRPFVPAAVAVLVSLAYRALYLDQLAAMPAFLEPVLDGAAHVEWARGWRAGTWPGSESFFRAPGYVVWLAGALAALGDDPVAVARAQLFLGAFVPGLTALLAGRVFGTSAAWIAGLGAAVYPPFLFFDAQLLAPFLATPLAVAAVTLSVIGLQRESRPVSFVAALLWGVAAVVRPPLLIAGLVLPLFGARRDRRGAGVAVLLILALPLLVTARNAVVGDPVFIASQGGLNFHLGNGREADGISATFKEAPGAVGYRMLDAAAAIAERDAGRTLRPSDVSRHWARRAWRDIGDAPGRWLALLFKKAFLFPSAREIPNNHDPVLFAEHVGALRMPGWGIWWPMAIVGAWVSRRHASARFVTVCALAIGVVTVLFFVNARFRMPVVPLLLVLAAGGIASVARAVRERRVRSLAAAAALATGAAVVAWSNPYNVPREPWVGGYVLIAEAERNRGEPVRSLRWVERALEIEPALYPARLAQIELLRRMGRIAEASDVAQRVLALRPDDAAVRHQNAILLDLADRPADALVEVDRALAREPTLPGAEVDRAVILARLGRREDALDALDEKIREGGPEAGRARMIRGQIESGGLDPP